MVRRFDVQRSLDWSGGPWRAASRRYLHAPYVREEFNLRDGCEVENAYSQIAIDPPGMGALRPIAGGPGQPRYEKIQIHI
jgi:hypothetical protein